jgi:hypothetical protein
MTIKLITLKTNHTLMGSVVEKDTVVTITEPVQVVNVPPRAANEQAGIAFMPFLEFSNEFRTGIDINKADILTLSTPVVELENQYNQVFGSGIQIAASIPKF